MDRSAETAHVANVGSVKQKQPIDFTENGSVGQFRNAILNAGVIPPDEILGDGILHRFKIGGKLNGAYVLHLNGRPAGYFQDFKQGIKVIWKAEGKYQPLSDRQKLDFKIEAHRQKRIHEAEEAAKHKAAANRADLIWNPAPLAPENHPYLLRKGIKPHTARLGWSNTLIIPIVNASRELVNLQFISEEGGKRFLSGGRKKGCFSVIGELGAVILICEGFATGASLNQTSGHGVVVALDAGNLEYVAIEIRKLYQNSEIIICGDNDESGVGQKAARSAALAIGCKYYLPPTPGNDWNDELSWAVSHE